MTMRDHYVGYGKPPREHRFKKGVCPNPAGRGRRSGNSIGAITSAMLEEFTTVTSRGGRTMRLNRLEILVRKLVSSAVKGNVESAASLLKLRTHAMRNPELEPINIVVTGGLPNVDVGDK